MMSKVRVLMMFFIWSLVYQTIQAENDNGDAEKSFSVGAIYLGDGVWNQSGGIKKGTAYLGLLGITANFDTEKAGLWKGGAVSAKLVNTHGDVPSENLVGDFQGFSNIEAGNHTFFMEMKFTQTIRKLNFVVGLQDMNVEFAGSDHGAHFINSSFGVHSTIAENISSPIFPLTSLGLTIKYNIADGFVWKNAIYDGEPIDFEQNTYNLTWNLTKEDGFIYFSEIHKDILIHKKLEGSYKLGLYWHKHILIDAPDLTHADENKVGFFGVADQMIWKRRGGDGGLGLFSQFGWAPQKQSNHHLYIGCGVNLYGVGKRKNDVIGLAFAHSDFRDNTLSETAVELSYKAAISDKIYIQPDIQYVVNPLGTEQKLNNAMVAVCRIGAEF